MIITDLEGNEYAKNAQKEHHGEPLNKEEGPKELGLIDLNESNQEKAFLKLPSDTLHLGFLGVLR